MKKPLLISLTALAVLGVTTITTLYAQTATGTSIINKMKATARTSFTLSADLNPGQTGFESAPVSGKKTGNMLTAAEWNRMLELISEGGSGGGSGWENVPLTDTADYDTSCLYRFDVDFIVDDANRKYMNATSAKAYMIGISNKFLQRFLDAGNSWMWGIPSTNKSQYGYRNSSGVFTVTNNVQITKMEKLCGGGLGSGNSASASSPAFYYCTNAQSLDSTNVPCYGASRNQGLGDGRYRVVSCHIKGSTGHESINSQLLNFGRTGLAAMQDKWNSLYTDSQWQLCIDGSVLVVDTQASAGSAGMPTSYPPILCSKSANSGKSTGYVGNIIAQFAATDCVGGVLPDPSNYIGVVQGIKVCGGIETFAVNGTSVQVWSNNLCKWPSGKDYDFDVLYIRK